MRLFIIFSLLFASLNANHISWYSSYDTAHEKSIKEKKALMVFLIKKDCKLCINTIQKTFMNQPYIDVINNKFIPILITKNQKSSYPLELLYTLEYPALFFLDNTELFICNPIRGEITPNRLENYLEKCK